MENLKAMTNSIFEKGEQFCKEHPHLVANSMAFLMGYLMVRGTYEIGKGVGTVNGICELLKAVAEEKN